MRRVAAAGREVDEERLARHPARERRAATRSSCRPSRRGSSTDRPRRSSSRRRPDDLLVLGQARVPLARAAAEDPVEVVEAPAVRPAVERPGRALLPVGRQMPLPERRGAVAVVSQDPRQRRTVARQDRRVAREPARELTDRAETDGVVVPAGQQRGACRRAQRRDMEPVVLAGPRPPCACSSVSGSGRRTCSGSRILRRRSARAARSGAPSGGVGCPIRFQSGCDPSSVLLVTPANGSRRIGRLVRSG